MAPSMVSEAVSMPGTPVSENVIDTLAVPAWVVFSAACFRASAGSAAATAPPAPERTTSCPPPEQAARPPIASATDAPIAAILNRIVPPWTPTVDHPPRSRRGYRPVGSDGPRLAQRRRFSTTTAMP